MHIFRKWRNYRQKPPFGSEIDWSDSITQGLVGCWLFNETIGKSFDIIDGKMFNMVKGWPSWSGSSLYFDGVDDSIYSDITVKGDFSLHFLCIPVLGQDAYSAIFSSANSVSDYTFQIDTDGANNWRFLEYNTSFLFGNIKADKQSITVRRTGDAVYGFVDGMLGGYGSGFSLINIDIVKLGCNRLNGLFFESIVDVLYIFNCALSDDEILRLHEEPYSFFLSPAPWFCIDLGSIPSQNFRQKIIGSRQKGNYWL